MTQYPYSVGVFIGRFQPFHHGHLHVIKAALAVCDKLVILIGSANRARSVRNPFTFIERRELLSFNLIAYDNQHGTELAKRVVIEPLADQLYFEAKWLSDVKAAVVKHSAVTAKIALIGYDKDKTTYYLKSFPEWAYVAVDNFRGIDATAIRKAYFTVQMTDEIHEYLSVRTLQFLEKFKQQPIFKILQEEQQYLLEYRNAWASAPYPVKFVTTDAVVICAKHILLIQRKFSPGKGLWALPGGHLDPQEWIREGLLRELREETAIAVSDVDLENALVKMQPFDHPQRSQVGRVITHAGYFKLPNATLPVIKACDDAAAACWLPLSEFSQYEDKMHDDHYQIVQYFFRECAS